MGSWGITWSQSKVDRRKRLPDLIQITLNQESFVPNSEQLAKAANTVRKNAFHWIIKPEHTRNFVCAWKKIPRKIKLVWGLCEKYEDKIRILKNQMGLTLWGGKKQIKAHPRVREKVGGNFAKQKDTNAVRRNWRL